MYYTGLQLNIGVLACSYGLKVVFSDFQKFDVTISCHALNTHVTAYIKGKGKGIRFTVLYPPKCSHDLPPLAGLYTRTPFQSPEGYSRAVGSI